MIATVKRSRPGSQHPGSEGIRNLLDSLLLHNFTLKLHLPLRWITYCSPSKGKMPLPKTLPLNLSNFHQQHLDVFNWPSLAKALLNAAAIWINKQTYAHLVPPHTAYSSELNFTLHCLLRQFRQADANSRKWRDNAFIYRLFGRRGDLSDCVCVCQRTECMSVCTCACAHAPIFDRDTLEGSKRNVIQPRRDREGARDRGRARQRAYPGELFS